MQAWLEHISESIQRRELFSAGESVLLAVSGGLDSMVLLHALHQLSSVHSWRLKVAHFNHQLRGRESDEDEAFVTAAARQLGLKSEAGSGDVKHHALAAKISLEMAARELRHRFLAETARKAGATSIALGQHSGDQVESFLLRLLRGGGGKTGMSWRSPSPVDHAIFLARPFLGESKEALRQYAESNGVAWREDSTNTHTDILRNRVRQDLIPLLKTQYQPAIDSHILHFMEITAGESEYAEASAGTWLDSKECRQPFDGLPRAVQRHIIRRQLLNLNLKPDFALIETLRLKPESRISNGPQQWLIRKETGLITVELPTDPSFRFGEIFLDASKPDDAVFGGCRFSWGKIEGVELETTKTKLKTTGQIQNKVAGRLRHIINLEVFDAEKIGPEIQLRHWQPGDRFQPIGMQQPAKLQDLLTNAKVPAEQRRRLVIGVSSLKNALFFVEGLRISELFKLDKNSVRGLTWEWRRDRPEIG